MRIVRFNSHPSRPLPILFPFGELDRDWSRRFAVAPDGQAAEGHDWQPLADIRETEDAYRLEVELPAVDPQGVRIVVEDGYLKVTGERRAADAETAGRMRRSERVHGKFTRSFRLPEDADADAIRATAEHGVVAITVGKIAKAQARRIAVELA